MKEFIENKKVMLTIISIFIVANILSMLVHRETIIIDILNLAIGSFLLITFYKRKFNTDKNIEVKSNEK